MKNIEFDYLDVLDLAAYLIGFDIEDIEPEEIEEALFKEFNISGHDFQKLICKLLPLVEIKQGKGSLKRGFADKNGNYLVMLKENQCFN